jgi:hypothetical protein
MWTSGSFEIADATYRAYVTDTDITPTQRDYLLAEFFQDHGQDLLSAAATRLGAPDHSPEAVQHILIETSRKFDTPTKLLDHLPPIAIITGE